MRQSRAKNPQDRHAVGIGASSFVNDDRSSASHRQSLGLWHKRIEERRDHGKQPIGAMHERHVIRAWEHRELGMWEQAEHLHCVLRAEHIAIPDQGGCIDRPNVFRPQILEVSHPFHQFVDQRGQIFRIRRNPVLRIPQICWHVFRCRGLEKRLPGLGIESVVFEEGRGDN
jgi:hypothetical protein